MDAEESIVRALSAATSSPELRSVAKDLSELALDSLLESEAIKSVPVLSSFLAIRDSVGRIRDAFLARKVLLFVLGISDANEAARLKFFQEQCSTDAQRQRLSRLVLHVLDDLREQDRVALISTLFVALLEGDVQEGDFSRLCDVARSVQRSQLALLDKINANPPMLVIDPEVAFLATNALIVQDFEPHSDGYGPRYATTSLGQTLLTALTRTPWFSVR